MAISTAVNKLNGVAQAQIAMGTPMNKAVLESAGLLTEELSNAGSSDLMLALILEDDANVNDIFLEVDSLLTRKPSQIKSNDREVFYSLEAAAENVPDSNFVVISVNGAYAAREAQKALTLGKHVMLFSDNVKIQDEKNLKDLAHDKGLLLMGPDCGTAIINGVGLGFANKVRRGNIGVIGASGTGSQEISVRVHEFGGGISQLIGTGGRDLSTEIGARMMLDALKMLSEDVSTEVIILVSKPPAKEIAERVLSAAANIDKPIFIWFLGYQDQQHENAKVKLFSYSKPCAMAAVIASGVSEESIDKHALNIPLIEEVRAKLKPEQKYIRGLFCGGTLCDEAMFIASEKHSDIYSNIHPDLDHRIGPNDKSKCHTFLDFGDDAFTNGKPHPMIDPSYRIERILEEGRDPEVGVLLLDFVLGFGANSDPVGITLDALVKVKKEAEQAGRHLEILAYVLGTDLDDPNVVSQVEKLNRAGITIASSSTNAGLLAREFVIKGA
ncbi:acyl-CoA synthetase FdrA [Mannheimia sp. AT1]|uniref:Acyl-CoA synthetase FdrA n=1 Tax=Mannheimia cairinae TaxID=3025936 RepID=A0ABT5MQ21_9PAST|nr:acyl-CoA synthetase FdrA [Mannheimia cairinae]MDD0824284.1 acyl-CoA synthetase FdrA [Mannheimia cairinae]